MSETETPTNGRDRSHRREYITAIGGAGLVFTAMATVVYLAVTVYEGRPLLNRGVAVPLLFAGIAFFFLAFAPRRSRPQDTEGD